MPEVALNSFPIPASYVVKLLVDMGKSNARFATIIGLFALFAPANAQWLHPDPNIPRTCDGKPVLTAPAPRMSGKPDLSGVWEAARPTIDAPRSYTGRATPDPVNLQIDQSDAADIRRSVFFGMNREQEPLKAEAIAVLSKRQNEPPPAVRCLPQGVPGVMMVYAFKIVQTPLTHHDSREPGAAPADLPVWALITKRSGPFVDGIFDGKMGA